MWLLTKIYKLIMKQYIIDSGQLGGLYNVVFSAHHSYILHDNSMSDSDPARHRDS
jgi:hypothetical protein